MTPAEIISEDLADAAQTLRKNDEPFAFATIVRTAGATAAKPGAKALLSADGTILYGWLGGGCTRSAVKKAAISALQSGQPQLVSIAPEELLARQDVRAGDEVDGKRFARNGCPSKGSIDIFIEPYLPMPQLVVLGASPVAQALATLAPQFHWNVVYDAPEQKNSKEPKRVIIVATQGQGDLTALTSALALPSLYVAFVGSARKFASLAKKMKAKGVDPEQIKRVKAPAGLDLGAVTPEEIALSILADLIHLRRAPIEFTND